MIITLFLVLICVFVIAYCIAAAAITEGLASEYIIPGEEKAPIIMPIIVIYRASKDGIGFMKSAFIKKKW